MADKEITSTILKLIDEKTTRRGATRIQVVKWGTYPPSLEKREFWVDENDGDKEKPGKAKGFNAEDFQKLLQNKDEIQQLLSEK